MTLPASGPLSLFDISFEFGGSTPHAISEYYRGGGLVPNTPSNAAIATSGQISFDQFYGTGAAAISLASTYLFQRMSAPSGTPSSGFIGFQLATPGNVLRTSTFPNSIPSPTYTNWYTPTTAGIGNSYEARLINPSGGGAAGIGPLTTWFTISTTRTWTMGYTIPMVAGQTVTGIATLEMRLVGSITPVYTSTITFEGKT